MGQTRFFFTAAKADAERLFPAFEAEFEEDGLPLARVELDETAGIDEISLYVDGDPGDTETRIKKILRALDAPQDLSRENLPDVDWVARSLEGLKPVRAGRFFVHGGHDRHRRRIGDISIEIEAGLAFGTGHHGTTAGCLETIEKVVRREHPRSALDLGAGSAVLAIAIAKMAHIPVLATDIDPVATKVAAENVRLNGVPALVRTATAPGFHHPVFSLAGPFDLIVANILARPLMQLAPQMARHVTPGGSLILSGILERQRDAVLAAYSAQHFRHVRTLPREGWVTLHLKR
ncbi:50S ribosomal protein L11 methyltransferase [Mesorhizobium sp. LHD-90]|uniref:50S ribosomal protein L11 methyltransferase n=1 Tax=Mesorhizobium sp. LHD-90 TaxID=3071414 RepID=UPI0027DFD32F|nr:50S ribosomal protein L11 methyltransferase [Mesorhizobium sp. LHD-90]MDQ6433486.1 50S ribosomal protein L11 methyltransferase [Mesorhizobium sp. LHD-90]